MTTQLYRHFDKCDNLLYVGVSLSAVRRLSEHRAQSAWGTRIARVVIENFPDQASALRAEAIAINDEKPACNIQRPSRPSRTYTEMMDLIQGAREEAWVRAWAGDPPEEIDETLTISLEYEKEIQDFGIKNLEQ